MLTMNGFRMEFTTRVFFWESIESEPQLTPPPRPGKTTVPWCDGGVKMPSLRSEPTSLRHSARSIGVRPQMSSSGSEWGWSGSGSVGKGWVGATNSPSATPPCGTGRSSTGKSGPREVIEQEDVAHLGRLGERRVIFVGASRMLVEDGLRRDVVVPKIVVDGLEVPAA